MRTSDVRSGATDRDDGRRPYSGYPDETAKNILPRRDVGIWSLAHAPWSDPWQCCYRHTGDAYRRRHNPPWGRCITDRGATEWYPARLRSEERRVEKECRSRWS